MTDDDIQRQSDAKVAAIQPSGAAANLPETNISSADSETVTKDEICEFLSRNPRIFFKSQQIDDPDLTKSEKQSIALEIYNDSRHKFLLRFGRYLQQHHLRHFELNVQPDDEEIVYCVKELMQSLVTHDRDVKNRRYVAMQAMIRTNSYFSEREMMKREPHLYEQMVGQYLTDSEKRIRDRTDTEECQAFSSILLENYDKDQVEKLRKQQKRDEGSDDNDDDDTNFSESGTTQITDYSRSSEVFPQVPKSMRKQWGGFEDEDDIKQSELNAEHSEKLKHHKIEDRFITAGEREMLRQEFVGIMYENFLDGKDAEFDYSTVDENTEYDDLEQMGQDIEDKYFDCDDDDEMEQNISINRRDNGDCDSESEDDLDTYMKHLNNHASAINQIDL